LKLKVNDPDAYNFDPRSLLINILTMFANMSGEETFLRHVVNDTRSYKTETFEKAVRILNNPKKGIVIDQDKKERFEVMVSQMKDMKNEIDEEEVSSTSSS
jgi:ubiquitin conjugation factor E4 B